jgi:hypothetical protein
MLKRNRGERTRKRWLKRVLSSNTKLRRKLVQTDQTRPRCEEALYQDKLHRVITRSGRIRSGKRLGSSRVGSAGMTVCGYHRRHHRHRHQVLFRRRISRVFGNRLVDARRTGTFEVAGMNLALESKELLTFGVSFAHACNRISDQVRSFIYSHTAASMANMLQLVYRLLPRCARVSSAPEPGCSLAWGKPSGSNLRNPVQYHTYNVCHT